MLYRIVGWTMTELCPNRQAGKVDDDGEDAGHFRTGADRDKNIDEAEKHHRGSEDHSWYVEMMTVAMPIFRIVRTM